MRNTLRVHGVCQSEDVFIRKRQPHGAAEIETDLKEATGNGGFFRPALGKRASVWEPPPPQPRRLFSLVPRSTSLRCGPRLDVARSHSRSDMPPACHSLRSCRFATRSGEAFEVAHSGQSWKTEIISRIRSLTLFKNKTRRFFRRVYLSNSCFCL